MQDICYNFDNFDDLTDKDLRDRIRNLNVHIEALPAIIGRSTTTKVHTYFSEKLKQCKADLSLAEKEISKRLARFKQSRQSNQ